MPPANSNTISTAMRALRVLEALSAARHPVSVLEVAASIGADRSTAYRMLMTLLEAGYVVRDTTSKNYRLGYRLLTLAGSLLSNDERSERVRAGLRVLADRTGETVHYCVLDNDATVLVFKATGTQLVSVDFNVGDRSPLHCTSIGKVLLAYQDRQARTRSSAAAYQKSPRTPSWIPSASGRSYRRFAAMATHSTTWNFTTTCAASRCRSSRKAVKFERHQYFGPELPLHDKETAEN